MSLTENLNTIQRLYIAYYQRPADPEGLIHWSEYLDKKGIDYVLANFVNSPEAQSLYGNKNITEVITEVYRSAFNRDPEPDGLNYWLNVYMQGKATLGSIVWQIINGAQGSDREAVLAKVESANNFTKVVDPELDGRDFKVTYSGLSDAEKAREFLKDVTYDSGTVATIEDAKAYIVLSGIADSSDPILKSNNPQQDAVLKSAEAKSNLNSGVTTISDLSSSTVKALDKEISWNKKTITYSFLQSDPKIGYSGWMPLDSFEKNLVREAFNKISKYINLKFVEVPSGGDIQFGSADLGAYGASGIIKYIFSNGLFLPPVYIHLDNSLQNMRDEYFYNTDSTYSGWGVVTIYHEIGHALGLKHPFEGSYILPENIDSIPYTVMSYTKGRIYYPEFSFDGTYMHCFFNNFATPNSLSLLDIQALQAKYGANFETNKEDNVYNPVTTANSPFYLSIWDAGGIDTIDFSNATGSCIINLTDGTTSTIDYISPRDYINYWSSKLINQKVNPRSAMDYVSKNVNYLEAKGNLYTGKDNLSIVKGTVIENVKTGSGDDIVYDNVYNNIIETGAGNDKIYISRGFDTVYGGYGYDKVYINVPKNSASINDIDWYHIVTGENFAVKVVGVEEIVFSDYSIIL